MSRPCKYPWFTWFNEDSHRIARHWFADLCDESIRQIVCKQARRMAVRASVTISSRWVWIRADRHRQPVSEGAAR